MLNEQNRRHFIQMGLMSTCSLFFQKLWATESLATYVLANNQANPGNFYAVFKNAELKEAFFLFLKNVYNIYPEKEFHDLISKLVEQNKTDEEIYKAILANLHTVKPFLSELTYALPALAQQKKELALETMQFLKNRKTIQGYLEIGTPGRYISELKNHVKIEGDIALVNVTEPSFSPIDLAERGQLFPVARYIPLDDYNPISTLHAEEKSFEVVTNYIGFHHSTLEKLDGFVNSIHRILKPSGSLILRDHDVIDEKMNSMVSLAHDVFNAGLKASWPTNHQEVRNFRSLQDWIAYLKNHGFEFKNQKILQAGDPTKNTLMEFVKV